MFCPLRSLSTLVGLGREPISFIHVALVDLRLCPSFVAVTSIRAPRPPNCLHSAPGHAVVVRGRERFHIQFIDQQDRACKTTIHEKRGTRSIFHAKRSQAVRFSHARRVPAPRPLLAIRTPGWVSDQPAIRPLRLGLSQTIRQWKIYRKSTEIYIQKCTRLKQARAVSTRGQRTILNRWPRISSSR